MKDLILLYTLKEFPGRVNLETSNRKVSFPGNLNSLEEKYTNLLRVDKSSLVNTNKIINYNSHTRRLYLENNVDCNVSFRKSAEVSKYFKKLM